MNTTTENAVVPTSISTSWEHDPNMDESMFYLLLLTLMTNNLPRDRKIRYL